MLDIAFAALRLLPSLLAGALAALSPLPAAAAEDLPGYDRLTVSAAHRTEPVAATVWYPAGVRTYRSVVGENPIFVGVPALVGAAIAEGRYPLVLLSHGSGGHMDGLSWLSSGLVEAGFMVLAVNHPGSTSGDSSPRRSLRLWERAGDLSAALDTLLADPSFGGHVDPSRIISVGFSLGGVTALNLAGLQNDRAAYADYCGRFAEKAVDCAFFRKGGVDFAALPPEFDRDGADSRVTATVAIDPGLVHAFTEESVAAFDKPALLVNLGARETRWPAVDAGPTGSNLAGRMKEAAYAEFAPASHFTVLPVCKPGAAELLKAEQDDPICDDPEGTDRAKVHAAILERVVAFLRAH